MSESCLRFRESKHTRFQLVDEHGDDHTTNNDPRSQSEEFGLAHFGTVDPSRDRFRRGIVVVLVDVAVRQLVVVCR